jgi:hypothetical protein
MKRPRIYGSEPECEAAVARAIQGAEQLLDHALDVRSRMVGHNRFSQDTGVTGDPFIIEDEWARDLRAWFEDTRETMSKYLQEQLQDVLPIIEFGLPRTTGTPSYATSVDRNEPWLRRALEELGEFQAALSLTS